VSVNSSTNTFFRTGATDPRDRRSTDLRLATMLRDSAFELAIAVTLILFLGCIFAWT
jgi:hypothetical protein